MFPGRISLRRSSKSKRKKKKKKIKKEFARRSIVNRSSACSQEVRRPAANTLPRIIQQRWFREIFSGRFGNVAYNSSSRRRRTCPRVSSVEKSRGAATTLRRITATTVSEAIELNWPAVVVVVLVVVAAAVLARPYAVGERLAPCLVTRCDEWRVLQPREVSRCHVFAMV